MNAAVMSWLRKVAALGILLVTVSVIAVSAVIPAWQRFDRANQSLAAGRELLARYLAQPTTRLAASDQFNAADNQSVYINGQTDALRIANLQATLADAAKLSGIRIASTRVIDGFNRDGVRMLGLQAQLSTELVLLQKLLYNLENQKPFLFIDGLHIARGPDGGTVKLPELDVTFVVAGAAPEPKE
jgi:Type II secretion system (T2SS), protein M subtype b